jgi:phospholipid/cholesterol/gamma-HCH transport system substrate-binding protein
MDIKVNYIIVGLFMILLTLAVIGSTIWLAGVHSTKSYDKYLTYMNEPVTGLSEKAPVKFNGVEVGFVDKIGLNPHNPQQVRLLLKIQQNTPITEATRTSLISQGLTGITVIGLKAEKVRAPKLKKKPGEEYPVIPSSPSLLLRLDQTLEQMSQNVNTVAKNLNDLFDEENKASFKHSLSNLSEITATANKKLPQLMSDFESSLTEAKAAAINLGSMSKSGNQSLKNFSEQTIPMAEQVMGKLKNSLDNIEQLTSELTKNPAMLLRGRNPAPLGPGEK